MPLANLRRHLFAVGVVLALTPALLTAAPVVPDKPKVSPAEKTRTGLDQNISIEFAEQPLDKALEQLREQTKLNFVIDRFTINQMGFQPEQMPVNAKLKDVKVKSALRSILTPYQLSYAIIGDTIVVSTDEMAMYKQMRQRVSLDVEKEELATALKKLARETATNVLVDTRVAKEAKTEVTLQMEDVPLETAVRLMCEMAGLKPVRVGNVLFVTTKQSATELRSDPDLAQPMGGPRGVQDLLMPPNPGVFPGGPGIGIVPGIGVVPVNPPPVVVEEKPAEKTPVDPEKDPPKPDKKDTPDKNEKPTEPPPAKPTPPATPPSPPR